MKRPLSRLALLAVSAALASTASAQRPDAERPDAEARHAAIDAFRAAHDSGLEVQVDSLTTTVSALVGGRFPGFAGPPETAARAFLAANRTLFGLADVSTELGHLSTRHAGASTRVVFGQRYRGVPVLHSGYLVAIDEGGAVHFVSGDVYPDVEVDTTPALSADAALSAARSDMSVPEATVLQEPTLAVWADATEGALAYHLVYQLELETREPLRARSYLIDAHSGHVLRWTSLIEDLTEERHEALVQTLDLAPYAEHSGEAVSHLLLPVTGNGKVYASNPLHGSPVSKPLFRLIPVPFFPSAPQGLNGQHVTVDRYNASDALAWSSPPTFNYAPTDPHFDEVMVYHHSDIFEGDFLSGIGLPVNQVAKVKATTRYFEGYAFAYSSLGEIYFQDGFSGLNNPTKEAAVIVHEYAHVMSETYNTLIQNDEADAMDEGYSDYFGIAYRRAITGATSTVIGEYIDQPGGVKYTRDVVNSANYAQFGTFPGGDFDGSGSVSPHDGGMVLAGALWAFRTSPGVTASDADEIALLSLDYLDNSPTFLDARNAALSAATALGYSGYSCAIKGAFGARGIGSACPPPPAPLTAAITGPALLAWKQYGTYTCTPTGGSGTTTYQWSHRYPAVSTNWTVTNVTTPTYSFQMSGLSDAELRCVVTRGTETAAAYKTVFFEGGGAKNGGAAALPFALQPARPNPASASVEVAFSLAEGAETSLVVYDALGREVARPVGGWVEAGAHAATVAVGSLPSGVYVVRLSSGALVATERLTVAR